MKQINIPKANERFLNGDGLTNNELDRLRSEYTELDRMINLLLPDEHYVSKEIRSRLDRLKSYIFHREN